MPHWVRDMAPSYHSSDWGGKRSCFPVSGPRPVPAVAAVAAAHEPPGEAHHPQDNPDDQQDEGAGDEGEVVQEPPRQRARHGRRLQVIAQVEVGNVSKLHTVLVHIAVHTFYTKQFSLPGLRRSGRGRERCRRRGALVWESTPHPPTVIKFPLGCVGAKSAGGEADWRNGIGIFLLLLRSSLIQFALAGGRAEEREREKKLGISFQFDADSLLESIFPRNGAFSSFPLHFTLPGEGAKRVSTHVLDREGGEQFWRSGCCRGERREEARQLRHREWNGDGEEERGNGM